MSDSTRNDLDQFIVYTLQRDARHTSASDIATEADLVIVEGEPSRLDRLVGHERLQDRLEGPTVVLRPHRSRTPGVLGQGLERLAF